jgi:hypothetical protein
MRLESVEEDGDAKGARPKFMFIFHEVSNWKAWSIIALDISMAADSFAGLRGSLQGFEGFVAWPRISTANYAGFSSTFSSRATLLT